MGEGVRKRKGKEENGGIDVRSENRRMLMYAQPPHDAPFHGLDSPHLVAPAQIPHLDFPIPAAGDELAQSAALHVHVGDPLLVLLPKHLHGILRLDALIEDAEGAVAVAGDEDVARHGIGGKAGKGRGGAGGYFL